jgi:predicted CoA-binding protein
MGEVEAGGQRAFENGAIGGDGDVAAVRLYQDFVLGHGHTRKRELAAVARTVGFAHADRFTGSGRYRVFKNPPSEKIAELLRSARTIAVVGLSTNASRPSHRVAQHLQGFGYRIIPVTPSADIVLGERAVPDLDHLPEVLKAGERVDIVDVFRRPEYVAAIVDDCIRLKLPALWLQDGVIDEAAAEKAQRAGVVTVMDRCLFRDRAALG